MIDHYRDSFNLLFNQIEDYLVIFDATGRIIQMNKAALERIGYSFEEMMKINMKLLHPFIRRTEVVEMVKSMLKGDLSKCLIPLLIKSGEIITLETRVFKGKWEGNDVLFGIGKDVTSALKPEDHISKVLRSDSAIMALSKLDTGEYIDVNNSFVETLGYGRNEVLGKRVEDLNIFVDPEFRKNALTSLLEQGYVRNREVMLRDKSGNVRIGLFSADIIDISNNKYLVTMTNDITEKRNQENKDLLLKNIQLVLDGVPFLAWMKDIKGRYVIVNRAFEDLYKMRKTEIIGRTDFDIFPFKIALEHSNEEEEIMKSKNQQDSNRLNLKNEVRGKWLEVFIVPFFEENGEVAGTIGVANDITKRTQLEMELANQKRFLKTMLDTIPDFIFYKDINSVLLGCNKGYAEKFLGVNEDGVRGKTDFELIKDMEHAKLCRLKDQETLMTLNTIKYEGKFVLTDGKVIDSETVKTPFWNEKGKVAGLIGIARDITARKSLEKQLREQAEYAELLFRTVPSAVLSVDQNGYIIRWNKIAEQITGYAAAEVMGKECSRVLHGIDRASCGLCGKATHSPLINEKCKIITKDGQIRHVLKSIAVVKDEFGQVCEKMECFEDITGLINMEAELRESKEGYAAIINNAPQFVVIHKKGIIKFLNEAGKEALEYQEEYLGRHIKEFLTDSSYERVNLALSDRAKRKVGGPYEIELVKKSGEIINVLIKGTDLTFEGEAATLAVMIDISESKRLNAKLRASEEKFRQLAETINEIFLISDRERIVYVSPAYERISGMSCQSLLDNHASLVDLIHPSDLDRIYTSFFKSFQNMMEASNEEFRIIRPDGQLRWLWLQSYPVRDEAIERPLKATSIVDITDRKMIEDQLREQERQTQMELLLAARVQQDSLPHPFVGDKVRVGTIFEPYSTVSGDFFNYKWFEDQNKLCGYIVDVSGHGVATALQTATFKMMLDNVLLSGEEIEEGAIKIINKRIMHYLYEDSFVALLYFEFDFHASVLKLISAGITLFLAAKPQECSLVPMSGCYLGIIDDPDIEIEMIPLKPGELYCMMSDGASDLIELHGISKQGSFKEYQYWLEKLSDSPDRNDDFTVICIEILEEIKETNVLVIKNDEELECAQVIISEFLERNAPLHAPVLEVAINEAVNNGFYVSGQVQLKMRRVGGKLIIRVKDDGPGFDTEEVNVLLRRDMFKEAFDNLLDEEGGRGILLMKIFCDKVIYSSKGNEVLMMKEV